MKTSRHLPRLSARRPSLAACLLLAAAPLSMNAQDPSSARESAARGPVIDGERFAVRQIVDPQQRGMPVLVFTAPESWRVSSQVRWNYGHATTPVDISMRVESPTSAEAFFAYSAAQFCHLRPGGIYRPGQDVGGLTYGPPQPPAQTLLGFARRVRGDHPELRVVGSQELPGLPAALRAPGGTPGLSVKVTYDLRGTPVEEEFYGIPYSVDIPYDGPQGRTMQTNWGLYYLHSFRGPRGTLEQRRAVFASIPKSARPNPAWQQRVAAVKEYLAEQFNLQLQRDYDGIAAAGRLSRQISANNDAMIASIDRRLQASRATSSSRGSGGRSAADKFDDYIRGVDTTNDPYYGTSQHSSSEQYHWTDGYGTYRNSNDAGYNPNRTEQGNWQQMQPTR